MNKKIIEMLIKIASKLRKEENLSKKEMDLIQALIQCAINDLGGIKDDNNGTGGKEKI